MLQLGVGKEEEEELQKDHPFEEMQLQNVFRVSIKDFLKMCLPEVQKSPF